MLIRVIRAVVGSVLLLAGLPLLLAGGVLWFAMQHRDAEGAYRAPLAEITTAGYAVVAPDVDALLRRDAPFARGGQTTLRLRASTPAGPAFVGLAPAEQAARYLAGVPYTQVEKVRLARGPLPVEVGPVDGTGAPPGAPGAQPFWLVASDTGTVEWVPAELRSQQLAVVVMDPRGRAPVTVEVVAEVDPAWLGSTTVGSLVLGTVLVLVAVATLAWRGRAREIVYVVPPTQVPEIAAHLGVPVAPAPAGPAPARYRPVPLAIIGAPAPRSTPDRPPEPAGADPDGRTAAAHPEAADPAGGGLDGPTLEIPTLAGGTAAESTTDDPVTEASTVGGPGVELAGGAPVAGSLAPEPSPGPEPSPSPELGPSPDEAAESEPEPVAADPPGPPPPWPPLLPCLVTVPPAPAPVPDRSRTGPAEGAAPRTAVAQRSR